ncbi:hypothetical protein PFISCL1PPCAC_20284, partial [Pristionchus fissidentatus]
LEASKEETERCKKELELAKQNLESQQLRFKSELSEKEEEKEKMREELQLTIKEKDKDIDRFVIKELSILNESQSLQKEITNTATMDTSLSEMHTSIIHARFTGISSLHSFRAFSRGTIIEGIPWAISIDKGDQQLGVYLNASVLPYKWSGSVVFKIHLISHKSDKIIRSMGGDSSITFSSTCTNWGVPNFISIEELFDDQLEFVKDDAIMLAAEVKVFVSS